MLYVDSGSRDPAHALASWFTTVLEDEITEFRLQSGFFAIDGVGPVVPLLDQLKNSFGIVKAVVGSNQAVTLYSDIIHLADLIGVPRNGASLGVVTYSTGLYHPKTYHFRRADGSSCAYVGSANFTYPGVSSTNIEAGIILDTRLGDSSSVVDAIASAVDAWFEDARDGIQVVNGTEDAMRLREAGILATVRPPRERRPIEAGEDAEEPQGAGVRLYPLVAIPRIASAVREATAMRSSSGSSSRRLAPAARLVSAQPATVGLPSAPRAGFPPEFLFEPNAIAPTRGAQAITGVGLPSHAAGLIVRVNKDSARRFSGATKGTANLSIPIATLGALRFGVYGRYGRPRAEYELAVRYVADSQILYGDSLNTNVMAYGYVAGESGNKDVRLVLPSDVRSLASRIIAAGYSVPTIGDFALFEWPSAQAPRFRITYLEPRSQLATRVTALFHEQEMRDTLLGKAIGWLPAGISPA